MFLIGGRTKDVKPTAVFLRSGDAVIMGGESRYCVHGVPRIIKGTFAEQWERFGAQACAAGDKGKASSDDNETLDNSTHKSHRPEEGCEAAAALEHPDDSECVRAVCKGEMPEHQVRGERIEVSQALALPAVVFHHHHSSWSCKTFHRSVCLPLNSFAAHLGLPVQVPHQHECPASCRC